MRKNKLFYAFWGIPLLIAGLVFLDENTLKGEDLKATGKIRALATVYPLMEFTQAVLGDRGEVTLLLPPGAEIHSWQPRPSDMDKIAQSDLFVCVGAELEPWIDDILNSVGNPKLNVFRASKGISLLGGAESEHEHHHDHDHDHGVLDPHIWLDFNLDQVIIDRLVSEMSELKPSESSYFKANGKKYKDRLQKLDQKFKTSLSGCKGRTFILGGHAAFGYLAKRYHLNQISLYGLNPDSTPTPRELVEVVELAKEHNIKVIYFEIHVSDELAKVIAREIGARTLVLNPAANMTRSQIQVGTTFFDIMNMNLNNLIEGLDCE
ncbi:metal ABC transporter solute-binding protein, Zn/Mn family [Acidobacteriota bacterium]